MWHHWLLTDDRGFVEAMWPVVEPAIDFVLDLQTPRGEILWARHADGTPWSFALLTGSSSICHSLRCAIAIAELLGHERPDWELSAARLAQVIREVPEAFAPKHRWAMDWYYPVLGGVVRRRRRPRTASTSAATPSSWTAAASAACPTGPWVTVAETCECALAYLAVGDREMAETLFGWAQQFRHDATAATGPAPSTPTRPASPAASARTYTAASSSSPPTPWPAPRPAVVALRRDGGRPPPADAAPPTGAGCRTSRSVGSPDDL